MSYIDPNDGMTDKERDIADGTLTVTSRRIVSRAELAEVLAERGMPEDEIRAIANHDCGGS